jgi:hypothetical protein
MYKTNSYHPRFTHSSTYYLQLILVLIDALNTHQTDHATATLLNSRSILSPAGKPWTASAVKQSLYKLRNFREVPSKLHQALLQLAFDGTLRASQALILFAPRRPQQGTL